MPVIRGHHKFDQAFAQIPNAWLRDPRLSFRARGIMAMLLTHSAGWQMTVEGIARENQEGKDAIRSAIKELEAFGYLVRYQTNDGRFGETVWKTQDPNEPLAENPPTEKPPTENPQHKNTNTKNTNFKNNKPSYLDGFIAFWGIYPRKTAKGEASRAFDAAIKKVDVTELLEAVQRFANDPNLPDPQYIPHAATWLRQERWEDGPLPPRALDKNALIEQQRQLAAERDRANREANEQYMAEMAQLEAQAAPPPKCEHGETIVRCKKCLYANS